MDALAIMNIVLKGISVAQALYSAGKDAAPAWNALAELFKGRKEPPTQAQMDAADVLLDKLMDDFNAEIA